jgi:hypothetical protein
MPTGKSGPTGPGDDDDEELPPLVADPHPDLVEEAPDLDAAGEAALDAAWDREGRPPGAGR